MLGQGPLVGTSLVALIATGVTGSPSGTINSSVPTGYVYPVQLRTWTQSYNPNLIGKDTLPIRQMDWPLPQTVPRQAITWIDWQKSYLQRPLRQTDWPLPLAAMAGLQLQSPRNLVLLSSIKPFNQFDWPLPIAQNRIQKGQIERNLALLTPPVVTSQPFNQFDWPLPARLNPQMPVLLWPFPARYYPTPVPPPVFTGTGEYFFKFDTQSQAFYDPVVGPYLQSQQTSIYPLDVFDIPIDSVRTVSGWWCMVIQPFPVVTNLINHPRLQFAISADLLFADQPCIVANNIGNLIHDLGIMTPISPTGYYISGLH